MPKSKKSNFKIFLETLELSGERLNEARREYNDYIANKEPHPRTLSMLADRIEIRERYFREKRARMFAYARGGDDVFIIKFKLVHKFEGINLSLTDERICSMPIQAENEQEAREIFKVIDNHQYAFIEPLDVVRIRLGYLMTEKL